MKEIITEILEKCRSSDNTIDQEKFVQLLFTDVIKEIKTTHQVKHCAFTTHDLGMVQCTIEKIVDLLKTRYISE